MPSLIFPPLIKSKGFLTRFPSFQGWYIFRHSEPKSRQWGQQRAGHRRQVFIQGHELSHRPPFWWLFSEVSDIWSSAPDLPSAGVMRSSHTVSLKVFSQCRKIFCFLFFFTERLGKEKEENHPLQEDVLAGPVMAIVPSTPHMLFLTPQLTWGPQT